MAAIGISTATDSIAPQSTSESFDSYRAPLVGSKMDFKTDVIATAREVLSTSPDSCTPSKDTPGLYITGLGSQYPPFLLRPEKMEGLIKKWFDSETPG